MSLKKESPSDVKLHVAALRGDFETLKRVLDSGKVHVDCRDEDHTTPLILASAQGHKNCVEELLEQGADPNAKRLTGTSALFFAGQGGHVEVGKILINAGAEIDSFSTDGATPLFVACQGGHVVMVKELLEFGANVNATMKDHATCLFIASQNGHRNVVILLLKRGALSDIDKPRNDGATPLWIAAQMGHDHICKVLLQNGATVDPIRCDGATPLFKAAHKGHTAVVEQLIKYNPNLGLLPNGESAMHAAALFGHLAVTQVLIAAGFSNFWLRNQEGLTPKLVAKREGYIGVYEYLDEKEKEYLERNASKFANRTSTKNY